MSSSENIKKHSVSVVIPAYNAKQHISQTIKSILAQTWPADEIIVIDDGSNDGTGEAIKTFGDKVRYIYQQNQGVSLARNTGIEAAKSEWIAFLDADDEWSPDKLKLQIELLKRQSHLAWTSANYTRCLCEKKITGPLTTPQTVKQMLAGKDYYEEFFNAFKANAAGWTGTMLIKRNVIIDAGMFDKQFTVAEDLDLWFRIAYDHPQIGYIAEPLATYHLSTAQSLSKTVQNMGAQAEMIKRHLIIAKQKNRFDAFQPCARCLVKGWIRSLLFNNHPEQVNKFLTDFDELLNPFYKIFVRILMISPRTTAWTCHLISKIVRTLKIRRHITNPPQKPRK